MARYFRPYDDTEGFHRLQRVLISTPSRRIAPWFASVTGSLISRASGGAVFVDCDEVVNNLYLGGESVARNKAYLRHKGFTHILNAAHGNRFGQVNTGQQYYRNMNIQYKGISLNDLPSEKISVYFEEAAEFIDTALRQGGKVFVHCVMGISRSVTLICAYLMIKQRYSAEQALTIVSRARDVRPNDGFLHQLLQLEQHLRLHRQYVFLSDA